MIISTKNQVYIVVFVTLLTEFAYYMEKLRVDNISPLLSTSLILPDDMGAILLVGLIGAFIGLGVARLIYWALRGDVYHKSVAPGEIRRGRMK